MTAACDLATAAGSATALLAVAAYRRSAQTARPWGESLREVAGQWDPRTVSARVRESFAEGCRAAVTEERVFDQLYSEAGAASRR